MSDVLDKAKLLARIDHLLDSDRHVCDIGVQVFSIRDEINNGHYDAVCEEVA